MLKMIPVNRFLYLLAFLPSFFSSAVKAQNRSTYDLSFLGAKVVEAVGERSVLVLLQASTSEKRDFPPVISPNVKYRFGSGQEQSANGKEDNIVRLVTYDRNIQEKSPELYHFISDKLDMKTKKYFEVLAIYIKTDPDEEFDKMTFTCSIASRSNQKARTEKKFEFAVNH
jgi:hypothetical protein